MLARLSDKYAIAGLPEGMKATDIFQQAIERVQGPTEIVIQSVEGPPAQRIAKAEFRYPRGEPKVKTMRFDAQGKLVESDLFVMRVQGS
ncbi:hypothetical protein [Usitatibacter palustris]|uniref:Uncharacterized protein n=1 Tax=Usitatibacter palustris TaxID=2732487 RepID=A0A6M4H549_9PROT|nr:hypothetical protein [Usitatibacter palustris]QJR14078.1 hypothetical protein DSM104440_00871 [Usitatibacter palustris]